MQNSYNFIYHTMVKKILGPDHHHHPHHFICSNNQLQNRMLFASQTSHTSKTS